MVDIFNILNDADQWYLVRNKDTGRQLEDPLCARGQLGQLIEYDLLLSRDRFFDYTEKQRSQFSVGYCGDLAKIQLLGPKSKIPEAELPEPISTL
jgi:hypothetical protein